MFRVKLVAQVIVQERARMCEDYNLRYLVIDSWFQVDLSEIFNSKFWYSDTYEVVA